MEKTNISKHKQGWFRPLSRATSKTYRNYYISNTLSFAEISNKKASSNNGSKMGMNHLRKWEWIIHDFYLQHGDLKWKRTRHVKENNVNV